MAKPPKVSCHEELILFKNAVRGSVWSPDEDIMPIFPCFMLWQYMAKLQSGNLTYPLYPQIGMCGPRVEPSSCGELGRCSILPPKGFPFAMALAQFFVSSCSAVILQRNICQPLFSTDT